MPTPAAPLAHPPGPSVVHRHVLPFDPRRDGFSFPNTFRWTDEDLDHLALELRPFLLGLTLGVPAGVGAVTGGKRGFLAGLGAGVLTGFLRAPETAALCLAQQWSSFGLCGGMALAAVERWPHRDVGPTTAQLQPSFIRALLRRRQAATLRASWPVFVRWWLRALAARGEPLAAADALEAEVRRLRARLDGGRPAVVGLAGDAPDPFSLHQVVAFGYEEAGPVTTFLVYDPNAPGRTRHLRAWTADGRAHVATDLPTGPKARGGCHIHRAPGRVAMLFMVEVEGR